MSEDKKESFKVVDKRRFNTEGESTGTETVNNPSNEQTKVQASQKSVEQKEQYEKIDFISFVVSLGTQTLVMLGEMQHPDAGPQAVNFEAAKQTIDVLAMLEEKTKGNLTPEEAKLMADILNTLRMTFVNKINKN